MAVVDSDMMHVQSKRRSLAWLFAGAAVAAVLVALWSSFESMVRIWWNDSSFAHGFLIPVLSGYAFWLKRDELRSAAIRPSAIAVIFLLVTVAVWYVAEIAGVQVLHQLAAAAMIGIAIWAVLGNAVAGAALFPLGYLLFMVPFGEFLVPALMEFTADITVLGLKATGIPVYRDGFFLTTANGSFEVAEACAGARYLLATVVLGAYFVWLEYQSWSRRILFMLAAFTVPILANGIRAYIVVMVAHLSNMRYLVGADHILFGQILFGVFVVAMFYIGVKFSDRPRSEAARPSSEPKSDDVSTAYSAAVAIFIVLIIGTVPMFTLDSETGLNSSVIVRLPAAADDWESREGLELGYAPKFRGYDRSLANAYMIRSKIVELNAIVYSGLSQGSELVNQQNRLFDPEVWRLSTHSRQEQSLADGRRIEFAAATLYRSRQRLRVHSFYVVGNKWTASKLEAKLFEIYDLITKPDLMSAFITVATPVALGQDSMADDILIQFIADHHDRLNLCLFNDHASDSVCLSDIPSSQLR